MRKEGLVGITEMVIRMNDAAWNLASAEVKAAFRELFLHWRVEQTAWPEGCHLFRGIDLVREKGDQIWRIIDDFIDFDCDDSKGAFVEFIEIHDDESVKTYSNRTSSKFQSVLSVVKAVSVDGSFASSYFLGREGEDEE